MDSLQITQLLKSDPHVKPLFQGVFPVDKLPHAVPKPSCMVVNTGPSTLPGSHWVAIYITETEAYYFDSYGKAPKNENIRKFLKKNSNTWYFSGKRLQGDLTTTCGQYCVLFLMHSCRGVPMQEFLDHFSKEELLGNDGYVTELVNDNFKVALEPIDTNFLAKHL